MSTEPTASSLQPARPDSPALPFPAPPTFALAPEPRPLVPPPTVRVAELAALVGLVGLADLSLFWGSGGLGDAVLLTLAAAIVVAAAPVRRTSARAFVVGGLVVALAARSCWQSSAWTLLLGLAGVFSIGVALRARRSFVPELFVSGVASAVGAPGQLWTYVAGALRTVTAGRLRHVRWVTIVVPLGVVTIFAFVFVAANPLLERWFGMAWDAVWGGRFFTPARLGFWLLAAIAAAGLLAPRLRTLRLSEELGAGAGGEAELAAPAETSVVTARNVLLGVNLLFLAYNALDAVYLWAGSPPPGLDHTSYAHRGTAWLTVSLLLSTVVLGLVFRGGMNARAPETRLVRTLGLAWAAQNFVLAAGTFRRIAMYIDDSGLTSLRCFGIAGVIVVSVAFTLLVLKVARRHSALWLLRSQFDAFAIALVVWTVLPIDSLVWSFNVERIEAGQERPLLHLFEQNVSAEGVAPLAALLHHPDPVVARGVASRLSELRQRLHQQGAAAHRWTQRELARARALEVLATEAPRIASLVPTAADSSSAFTVLRERAYRANGMDPNRYYDWRF